MKGKKWCALLMASVMLAGTLTGCAVVMKDAGKWQRAGGRRRKKATEGGKITKSEKEGRLSR